jgi:geranylgeranyl diphosphate synthase type I
MRFKNFPAVLRVRGNASENILSITEFKDLFDRQIDAFLLQKVESLNETVSNKDIAKIVEHAAKIARVGSKRIRPYVAYLGYKMCRQKEEKSLFDALVGIELFHVFALIHDDIIDEGHERHTVQTLHKYVESLFPQVRRPKHIGDAQALLVGDLVFAWSQEALTKNTPTKNLEGVRTYFFKMIEEVVAGQMIDVDLSYRKRANLSEIEEKNRLKTARYTFVNPLKIGAALAGDTKTYDAFFEEFGTAIGGGYQVQDDLLDICGDSKKTGKDVMRDLEEAQHTFFTQYVFDNGTDEQKKKLESFWGNKLSPEQKMEAKKLFEDSGAIDEGRKIINTKLKEAEDAFYKYRISKNHKEAFGRLVDLIKKRSS